MLKQIQLNNVALEYSHKQSRRARNMRLTVFCDASVVVTTPYYLGQNQIEKFLRSKANWLINKVEHFERLGKTRLNIPRGKQHFEEHKAKALEFVAAKVSEQNLQYNFCYNKITVKNNKTRWGSCSRKGNLNFNYRVLFLPVHLAEYIVTHELCHLAAFNHSQKFWELVGTQIPDYRSRIKELRKISAH